MTYGNSKEWKQKTISVPCQAEFKRFSVSEIDSYINNFNKCILYKHVLKNDRLVQSYLKQGIPAKYEKYTSKFHLSAHSLKVEKGRYDATARENRLCTMCNLEDIEAEYHFYYIQSHVIQENIDEI